MGGMGGYRGYRGYRYRGSRGSYIPIRNRGGYYGWDSRLKWLLNVFAWEVHHEVHKFPI